MGSSALRFKASNGKLYDFGEDEAKAEAFLKWADGKGIKYTSAYGEDEPDGSEPEPPTPATAEIAGAAGAPVPSRDDSGLRDPEQPQELPGGAPVPDAIRGLTSAARDEYAGLAPKEEQAHVLRVLEDPVYFGKQLVKAGGNFLGNAIGGGGPGGFVSGLARGALGGALTSGTDAVGREDSAIDALKSAAVGATAGGAIGGTLGAGESLLRGTGDLARNVADRGRLQASGVSPADLAAYKARNNVQSTEAARRQMVSEAEGLVKPNILRPRNASEIQGQYRNVAGRENARIEAAIDEAGLRGAQVPQDVRGDVARELYYQADDASRSGYNAAQAGPLSQVARNVELGPQSVTPQDLRAQKIGFDKNAYKGGPGTPEALQGQANLAAGNQYRQRLDDYVGQGGPEVAQQFRDASDNYGLAATFRDAAEQKALKQNTAIGGSGEGGFINRVLGALPGADYAADAIGNVGAIASSAFQGIGDAASWMAKGAPGAASYIASGARGTGSSQQRQAPEQGGEPYSTNNMDNRRGHRLATDASNLMQSRPEVFQPFIDSGALPLEVVQGDDDERFAAQIESLMRTNDNFARTIGPLLGQRSR